MHSESIKKVKKHIDGICTAHYTGINETGEVKKMTRNEVRDEAIKFFEKLPRHEQNELHELNAECAKRISDHAKKTNKVFEVHHKQADIRLYILELICKEYPFTAIKTLATERTTDIITGE